MQDVFGIIPGDTDYRIFAKDHGNIPGLDIILLLGGYYYHTSYDTMDRLMYVENTVINFIFNVSITLLFSCFGNSVFSSVYMLGLEASKHAVKICLA